MKKLLAILLVAICVGTVQSQIISTALTADTLVSGAQDTTTYIDRYKDGVKSPPGRNETIYINTTEIGSNTTHNWLQVDFYLCNDAETKTSAEWTLVKSILKDDWTGYNSGDQSNFIFPLPWLSDYSGRFLRLILKYWRGTTEDSTSCQVIYSADRSLLSANINPTYSKEYQHYDLFRTGSARTVDSILTISTIVLETNIEVTPGVYRKSNRGEVWVGGDGVKCDDDTVEVLVKGWYLTTGTGVYIDTLLLPISLTTSSVGNFSFTLPGTSPGKGTYFPDALRLYYRPESNLSADSIQLFTKVKFWIEDP